MRVLLVSGSFPPDLCGIGDYTARLMSALQKSGIEVGVLTSGTTRSVHDDCRVVLRVASTWRLWDLPLLLKQIRHFSPDVVHLQYPGAGYGFSLGPHFLALFVALSSIPLVVTAHEFNVVRFLRKVSIAFLLVVADAVIFTTDAEKLHAVRLLGRLRTRLSQSTVIPIGTNLPGQPAPVGYDRNLISFWGMFHHGKGLEELLRGFKMALDINPVLRLQLVGGVRAKDLAYVAEIKTLVEELGLGRHASMHVDKPVGEVVRLLERSCAVVLPFVDGATFRRGTLIAALCFGLPVITTRGPDTPPSLVDRVSVVFADSPADIAEGIILLGSDEAVRRLICKNAGRLGVMFDWDGIVKQHLTVYRNLLYHQTETSGTNH